MAGLLLRMTQATPGIVQASCHSRSTSVPEALTGDMTRAGHAEPVPVSHGSRAHVSHASPALAKGRDRDKKEAGARMSSWCHVPSYQKSFVL